MRLAQLCLEADNLLLSPPALDITLQRDLETNGLCGLSMGLFIQGQGDDLLKMTDRSGWQPPVHGLVDLPPQLVSGPTENHATTQNYH